MLCANILMLKARYGTQTLPLPGPFGDDVAPATVDDPELCGWCLQAILTRLGMVSPPQAAPSDGNHADAGDLARARLNSAIDAGGTLTNRDTLQVTVFRGLQLAHTVRSTVLLVKRRRPSRGVDNSHGVLAFAANRNAGSVVVAMTKRSSAVT
jgi:hypothetical protein